MDIGSVTRRSDVYPRSAGTGSMSAMMRNGRSALGHFARDTRGDVAMLFGLMALGLFMMIGLAVDYARFINARNQTIAATDAAVLAAARVLQTNGGNQAAALDAAKTYYLAATKNRIGLKSDSIGFAVTDNATAIVTTGNATIATPFMGLGGTKSLPILHSDGSDYSKAVIAAGGNSQTNLEIGMMLDISGSMSSGTKLADMKAAANDLVDIVVWDDQSKYTSRLAIVPFSGDVLPTSSLFQYATGVSSTSSSTVSYTVTSGKKSTTYTYKSTPCVAERPGKDYTDTTPGTGHYVLREFTSNGACIISSTGMVQPMTNDKTTLHNKIKNLVAGGSTAGHVGTAWTYYMLSPNWASGLPSGSKPVAYGADKTKKIAVLMTDGAYNMEHDSKGVLVGSSGAGSSVNGIDSAQQAVSVCTSMKNNGIEIFTVGFDFGSLTAAEKQTAIYTLSNCATDASHFYNSQTGDALKAAFRDIALKIASLYLSQ